MQEKSRWLWIFGLTGDPLASMGMLCFFRAFQVSWVDVAVLQPFINGFVSRLDHIGGKLLESTFFLISESSSWALVFWIRSLCQKNGTIELQMMRQFYFSKYFQQFLCFTKYGYQMNPADMELFDDMLMLFNVCVWCFDHSKMFDMFAIDKISIHQLAFHWIHGKADLSRDKPPWPRHMHITDMVYLRLPRQGEQYWWSVM